MKLQFLRGLAAISLTLISGAAMAGPVAGAVSITLTGWAFNDNSSRSVKASGFSAYTQAAVSHNGAAGAFSGALSGTGSFDTDSFATYCIELEESFRFGASPMTGYSLVSGVDYFASRHGDGGIAERLGRLLTWVDDNPDTVHSASTSASLQLAIWNLIYDTDFSVAPGAHGVQGAQATSFHDTSSRRQLADTFLEGAQATDSSRFSVFALERTGSQDFLLVVPRQQSFTAQGSPDGLQNSVPEPASLALVAAALAGLSLTRRRRA